MTSTIKCLKRDSQNIIGFTAVDDLSAEQKYYSAEEVFTIQGDDEHEFFISDPLDPLNAYNVRAKQFSNGSFIITAEIPVVAKLLDDLPECE